MAAYALVIFLGAFLLFQIQPLLAKYILPWYGGTKAVWTTCLLFFQLLLLAGYAYSHLLAARLESPIQVRLHGVLLGGSVLLLAVLSLVWGSPILADPSWSPEPGASPVFSILVLLAVSIGLPYLMLASTSPLLQRWASLTHPERTPYRLYSLSNIGSLLGLLTYPFLIEPSLALQTQALLWTALYVLFAAGCLLLGLRYVKSSPLWSSIPAPGFATREPETMEEPAAIDSPTAGRFLLWFSLAACASTLLLAATNRICLEVAVVPFLWILPLSLYLLSFILCFDHPRWYQRILFLPAYGAATFWAIDTLTGGLDREILTQITVFSAVLFAGCMICHGELVRLKPAPRHLTAFYLCLAAGGAAGGIFVAIVAPVIFSSYWELHLAIWLIWLLAFVVLIRESGSPLRRGIPGLGSALCAAGLLYLLARYWETGWGYLRSEQEGTLDYLYFGLTGLAALIRDSLSGHVPAIILTYWYLCVGLLIVLTFQIVTWNRRRRGQTASARPIWAQLGAAVLLAAIGAGLYQHIEIYHRNVVEVWRSFYGTLSVQERVVFTENQVIHYLMNGQTLHGFQYQDELRRRMSTSYYGEDSGIGRAITNHPVRRGEEGESLRLGVIGLGIGTLAVYGGQGDTIRFYEINPDVIRLARGEGEYFSYLGDSEAQIEIVEGDARVALEREARAGEFQRFDVLAVDAFNSDSIPVHLLTLEAFRVYLEHLRGPVGVIAVHITNRYLDLRPVVQAAADTLGLHARLIHSTPDDPMMRSSRWVLLSRSDDFFQLPPFEAWGSNRLLDEEESLLWTDDFSNLFRLLRRQGSL